MNVEIVCTCGKVLRARREFAGRRVKCPKCSSVHRLPALKILAPNDEGTENGEPGKATPISSLFEFPNHLNDETLLLHALGKLGQTEAETVGKHLADCSDCRTRADLRARDRPSEVQSHGVATTSDIPVIEIPKTPHVTADFEPTVLAHVSELGILRGSQEVDRFEIGVGGVIGRDSNVCQYHLDHPHVSRRHANLVADGKRVVIADLKSSNGTFVNGHRLDEPTVLKSGDRIDIGPFSLQYDGAWLVSQSRSNNIELAAPD